MSLLKLSSSCYADVHRSLPESTKPILLPERLKIARKPRSNGASQVNGSEITTNGVDKRKRSREEVDASEDPDTKRRNLRMDKTDREDFVLIEEKGNGAIVIDDD